MSQREFEFIVGLCKIRVQLEAIGARRRMSRIFSEVAFDCAKIGAGRW